MTDYVWPLQCVGLVLTAALIGALVLVMEEALMEDSSGSARARALFRRRAETSFKVAIGRIDPTGCFTRDVSLPIQCCR